MHINFYEFRVLKNIGISTHDDYEEKGAWFGNSSMEGQEIFKSVTYNLSDLVKDVKIVYENGEGYLLMI